MQSFERITKQRGGTDYGQLEFAWLTVHARFKNLFRSVQKQGSAMPDCGVGILRYDDLEILRYDDLEKGQSIDDNTCLAIECDLSSGSTCILYVA